MHLAVLKGAFDKNPNLKVEISGHTDNVGDAGINLKLSQDRASAVKTYLVGKGIDGSKISTLGYGQTKAIDTNDTEEGKSKNRRIEFKILTF
ncbi:MAG: OmpA family protein [Saprospiraceae bacterium]|nr:OmpA family protein [Saprospiraceae bacterium]